MHTAYHYDFVHEVAECCVGAFGDDVLDCVAYDGVFDVW